MSCGCKKVKANLMQGARCSIKSDEYANTPMKTASRKSRSRKSKSHTRKSKTRKSKSLSRKSKSRTRKVRSTSPRGRKATPFPRSGSLTKGWKSKSPKHGTERHELKKKNKNCFLRPSTESYPVCDTSGKVSCSGIQAAYQRSRQMGEEGLARKALSLRRKVCS